MVSDSGSVVVWIGLTFVAPGLVKGVVGLGLPMVAMGVLSLVMRRPLPPQVFCRWYFVGLIVIGGHMVVRALELP